MSLALTASASAGREKDLALVHGTATDVGYNGIPVSVKGDRRQAREGAEGVAPPLAWQSGALLSSQKPPGLESVDGFKVKSLGFCLKLLVDYSSNPKKAFNGLLFKFTGIFPKDGISHVILPTPSPDKLKARAQEHGPGAVPRSARGPGGRPRPGQALAPLSIPQVGSPRKTERKGHLTTHLNQW